MIATSLKAAFPVVSNLIDIDARICDFSIIIANSHIRKGRVINR